MMTVRLYGHLGRDFGREFKLNVKTAQQALRALITQVKGLRERLGAASEPGYHLRMGPEFLGEEDLGRQVGQGKVLRIVPATVGSSATARVVVGAVLVVAGAYFAQPWMVTMGLSLVVGGVAELLAPQPKMQDADSSEAAAKSYAFAGPQNTVGQGPPVPVGYGELLCGGHVISAQVMTDNPVALGPVLIPAPGDDEFPATEDVSAIDNGNGGEGWDYSGPGLTWSDFTDAIGATNPSDPSVAGPGSQEI